MLEKKREKRRKKRKEREFGKLKYRCIREKRGNLYIGKKKFFGFFCQLSRFL